MQFNELINILEQTKNPRYSGLVIDSSSKYALLHNPEIAQHVPENFEIIAHHMTIKLGGLTGTEHESRLNATEKIFATHVGVSDNKNVVAVKVTGKSDNKIPHITIAINRDAGAKPVESNYITNWQILQRPISLVGVVAEIY